MRIRDRRMAKRNCRIAVLSLLLYTFGELEQKIGAFVLLITLACMCRMSRQIESGFIFVRGVHTHTAHSECCVACLSAERYYTHINIILICIIAGVRFVLRGGAYAGNSKSMVWLQCPMATSHRTRFFAANAGRGRYCCVDSRRG